MGKKIIDIATEMSPFVCGTHTHKHTYKQIESQWQRKKGKKAISHTIRNEISQLFAWINAIK